MTADSLQDKLQGVFASAGRIEGVRVQLGARQGPYSICTVRAQGQLSRAFNPFTYKVHAIRPLPELACWAFGELGAGVAMPGAA